MAVVQPDTRLASKRFVALRMLLYDSKVLARSRNLKWMKKNVSGAAFSLRWQKKANTAVTDVVEQLLTVIIKHDKTSGWTCQSSMDKDHPLTPAICAASQTRLCVCFHIPLPPTKHHWAIQSLLPRNDCKSGSERVFNKSTNLFINNYVVTKVIRNCLNSWCDTVAQ